MVCGAARKPASEQDKLLEVVVLPLFVLFNRHFPRDRDPLPLGAPRMSLARPLLGVEAGEMLFVIVRPNAKAASVAARHVCSRGEVANCRGTRTLG